MRLVRAPALSTASFSAASTASRTAAGLRSARRQFAKRAGPTNPLRQFDGLELTHPTFVPLAHAVVTRLRRHIAEDRSSILPRLADAATPLGWVAQEELRMRLVSRWAG